LIVKWLSFVRVKKSFWVLCFAMFLMGLKAEFITLLSLILLHELSHVFAAKLLKAEVLRITILPVGITAEIKNFDFLPTINKVLILIAGPLFNLILACLSLILFSEGTSFFITANFAIFAFNMLPIIPLDGGNIVLAAFNNRFGILPIANSLAMLGKFFSVFIMLFGLVQVILYPFNISLLIIGLYLYQISKNKQISYQNAFFKILEFSKLKNAVIFMPVKAVIAYENFSPFEAVKLFGFNCYTIIYFIDQNGVLQNITEYEIIKLLTKDQSSQFGRPPMS